MARLIAKAGEICTCTNGHPVCEVVADIYEGETSSASQFKNWADGRRRGPGSQDVPWHCEECGAPAMKHPMGCIGIHINGEWRSAVYPIYPW